MAVTAASLVVLMALAYPVQGVSTFVVRIAELLLAGGAAYLVDDAAVALTVTAPRSVWRRRLPVLVGGVGVLGTSWLGILLVLHWQASALPLIGLTWEVVVLCCLAVAAAAVLARQGEPEPGGQVAPGVFLLGMTAVLAEPILRLAIFVPEEGMGAVARQLWWWGAVVIAVVTVLLASSDPATTTRLRAGWRSVARGRGQPVHGQEPDGRGEYRGNQHGEQQAARDGQQPSRG